MRKKKKKEDWNILRDFEGFLEEKSLEKLGKFEGNILKISKEQMGSLGEKREV